MGNQYGKWTKEEVIKGFYDYYEKHGVTPATTDMKNSNGLPSWKYINKLFGIYYIEEFYNYIGLKIVKRDSPLKLKEENVIKECKDIYMKLGRIPTKAEFESMATFSLHRLNDLGGIREAFKYYGIHDEPIKTEQELISESIDELIRISNELGKSPTAHQFEKLRKIGYQRNVLERKLGLTWNNVLEKYSPFGLNIDRGVTFTKDEVINMLVEFKNKLGRTPKVLEIKKYNVGCSTKNILLALKVKTIAEIYPIFGWELYGSDIYITTEKELLDTFERFVLENNRLPLSHEFGNNDLFTKSVYLNRYGSIRKLCDKLDIDYKQYRNNCKSGVICYDNNNEMCRSIAEQTISNFMIENKIVFKKETKYKQITLDENDRRRFDWEIQSNGNIYYVEYFGMYRTKSAGKVNIDYMIKIDNKINDLKKFGVVDNCIFIYPKDFYNSKYKNIILDKLKI